MPDATPPAAPTSDAKASGSATNGGALPGGDAKPQGGAGQAPDGAAPGGVQAGSGGQGSASSEKKPIQLKLPDGWQDDATSSEFRKAAEEFGLDSDKAQRFFDLYTAREKSEADALSKAQAEWLDAAKADKEIGGASFEANKLLAKKAMVKFGGESLQNWLQDTGLGNHPELVRAFVRIGKAMSEDSLSGTLSTTRTSAADDETSRLRKLYPNSPEMFEA